MTQLDPPPSHVDLVTSTYDPNKRDTNDKSQPDSIWKKWLNNLYEKVKELVAEELQKTAFSLLATAQDTPIVNIEFSYNLNSEIVETRLNHGLASVDSNRMKLSTGAAANQSAQLLSVVPVKYYAGIGTKILFTSLYTTGVANSTQIMGVGDAQDGFFFGYNGADFGILRRSGGKPEIRTIQVTTASSNAEDITITLNSVAVTDVTVTSSGVITTTANEIAAHDYSDVGGGWEAVANGDIVEFVSWTSGSLSGTYSLSGATSAVGSPASLLTGVAATDTWTPQSDWNVDTMTGTGNSMKLEPTKGNIYKIQYQWLGFGMIRFAIEHDTNGELETVHEIRYANANLTPSINNPTLSLCALVSNASNTSDLVVFSSSMAGFAEGKIPEPVVKHVEILNKTFTSATIVPAITLHSSVLFQGVVNKVRVKITNISVEVESGKPVIIQVIRGAVLVGASFLAHDSDTSVIDVDTTATATVNGEILDAFPVSSADDKEKKVGVFIEAHKQITIAGAQASSGTNSVTKIIIDWEEDF